MKKTLQKLALSAMLVGGSLLGTAPVQAQSGQAPYLMHDVPAGNAGFFARTSHSAAGQGVATDFDGKVWSLSYNNGVMVQNPDGTAHTLSAAPATLTYAGEAPYGPYVKTVKFPSGHTIDLANNRGIAIAADGNILLVTQNNTLVKLDAKTGTPIAHKQLSVSLAGPSSDANGNVLLVSVVGDDAWIVKQSATGETFDIVKDKFSLGNRHTNNVVRSAAISKDGRTIWVPFADKAGMNKYTSTDGLTWTFAEEIAMPAASAAIWPGREKKVFYVTFGDPANVTASPATLHYRDEQNSAGNWSAGLPEIDSPHDIRGLTLSKGYDTIYVATNVSVANPNASTAKIHRYWVPGGWTPLSSPKDILNSQISAFPVPTTGLVTIELPESVRRNSKIQVTDLSGKNVMVQQSAVAQGASLDLTGLSSGTYLVVLNTPEGNIVRRVVKQ